MDPGQVQAFRNTVRQLLPPMSDLYELLFLMGGAPPVLKTTLSLCEESIRGILSTFDPDAKLAIVKEFCESKFPKILELSTADFVQDLRKPIALFPELIKDFVERQHLSNDETADIIASLTNLDETLDKIDLESEPINVQQQIEALKQKCSTAATTEFSEFEKTAESYRILYAFISEIKSIADYVEKVQNGEPPRTSNRVASKRSSRGCVALPVKKTSKVAMPLVKADESVVENLRLVKIDAEPLLFRKDAGRMRTGLHQGNLCLKGLVPPKLGKQLAKNKEGSMGSRDNSDSSSSEVDEVLEAFDHFMSTFTPNGQEGMMELLRQKCVILAKENTTLRDNYDIVSKQKEEMMQLYEDYISELMKQNEVLKKEIAKLKEKTEEGPREPPMSGDGQ